MSYPLFLLTHLLSIYILYALLYTYSIIYYIHIYLLYYYYYHIYIIFATFYIPIHFHYILLFYIILFIYILYIHREWIYVTVLLYTLFILLLCYYYFNYNLKFKNNTHFFIIIISWWSPSMATRSSVLLWGAFYWVSPLHLTILSEVRSPAWVASSTASSHSTNVHLCLCSRTPWKAKHSWWHVLHLCHLLPHLWLQLL